MDEEPIPFATVQAALVKIVNTGNMQSNEYWIDWIYLWYKLPDDE